jgi:hypothetical protein
MRVARRYVLYLADEELGDPGVQELSRILEGRHGKLKFIPVRGNGRALIVRTTPQVAAELRERSGTIQVGEIEVSTVLSSGVIGKLKRRAGESGTIADGKVPER